MFHFDEIKNLPVTALAASVAEVLSAHETVILKAPPGSGKSTALPALFIEQELFADKKILMLEPRRIACSMVAARIAFLLGEQVGETVGYRMRGDKKISSKTRLEIVTEGTFTRLIQNDMELADYDLIIFDEFHERNIHSDLGLALSLDVKRELRPDLSLLVMSATLDISELQTFLPEAHPFECEGKVFDLEINFSPEKIPFDESVNAVYRLLCRILKETDSGNILVFLPGAFEIEMLASLLRKSVDENVITAPLYGALSKAQQQKALQKTSPGERKIVIATNIAESSVTIDDIKIVIDSGWEKKVYFEPGCGMDRLRTQRIAKSSAIQRGGRAGRVADGKVYRLYTHHEFEGMTDHPVPEIACVDLANFCIELAMWGCSADDLDFLTPPLRSSLMHGEKLLKELGLIDENGSLLPDGREVGNFPGSCRVGKLFLEAKRRKIEVLGCEIAAMLEEKMPLKADLQQNLEYLRRNPGPSFKRNLEILLRERHLEYRKQDSSRIGELLFCGFPDRAGKRCNNSHAEYQLANGRRAVMNEPIEGSAGEFIIAPLLDLSGVNARIFGAASFDEKGFTEDTLSHYTESYFDSRSGTFISERVTAFQKMVLNRRQSNDFDADAFRNAVLDECRKRGIAAVFGWDDEDLNFFNRCKFAYNVDPDNFPLISESTLLEEGRFIDFIDTGARSLNALRKIPFKDILMACIPYEVISALDNNFPLRFRTPGGSLFKIRYEENDAILSVPVSEMYGTKVHPVLGKKCYPLKIELLSPAMRPVQITGDIAAFWRTNWTYVQKELKQRYIKHFWPDDPAEALPGRSIRKK